jgi:hypothetical protein
MGSREADAHALVTVAIIAYNSSRTIVQAVESVLAQSWPALDVLVVDDGSTDDTLARLAPFGDRIRVSTKPNGGIATNRNAGCAHAIGELIALMDADDVCMPDRIAIQASVMSRHPEVVLCSSDFSAFDQNGVVSGSHGATYYSAIAEAPRGLDSFYPRRERMHIAAGEWPGLDAALAVDVGIGSAYPELVFGNFVHPPTAMVRRSVLAKAGLAVPGLRWTSEWEWFVRIARHGDFAHVHRPLLDYRISSTQITSPTASAAGMAVEVLETLDRMLAADPALGATHRRRVRQCVRDFGFDAAYALAGRDRAGAARMLLRSIRNGGVSIPAMKTAARLLMPRRLAEAMREARSRARAW